MHNIILAVFLFNIDYFGESTEYEPEHESDFNNPEYSDYESRQRKGNQSTDYSWINVSDIIITTDIETTTTVSFVENTTVGFQQSTTVSGQENTTESVQENATAASEDDADEDFLMKAREKLTSNNVDIWGDQYSKFKISGIQSNGMSGTIKCPDDPAILLKWQKWLTVSIFNSFEENESKKVTAHLINQSGAPWKGVRDQAHWPDNGWRPQSVILEEFSPGFLKINIVYHFKSPADTYWTEYTMFLEFRQYQYNASNVVTFGHSRIAFHNKANIPGDLDWYKYNPNYAKNGYRTLPFKFGERFIVSSEWLKDANQPYKGAKEKKKHSITTIMAIGPDEKYEDDDKVLELTAGPGKKAKKTWLTYLIRKYYGNRPISRDFELHEEVTKNLGQYKKENLKPFNKDKISVMMKTLGNGTLLFKDTMFQNNTEWNITKNQFVGSIKHGNTSIEYAMLETDDGTLGRTTTPASTRETTPKYVSVYPPKQRMNAFFKAPGWTRLPAVVFLIIPLIGGVCFCCFGILIPFFKELLERMTADINDPSARTS